MGAKVDMQTKICFDVIPIGRRVSAALLTLASRDLLLYVTSILFTHMFYIAINQLISHFYLSYCEDRFELRHPYVAAQTIALSASS